MPGSPVTVPLEKEGGFYYAQVEVNGRPFRFTLETGAGFAGISQRAANALGLSVDSREVVTGTTSRVATLQTLRLGAALLRNVTVSVRPEWDNVPFDGIISIPLLRDMLATLDLGSKMLRLEHGALPAPNGRNLLEIPGQDRGGRIDIPLTIGGVKVAAVLDTRADVWLIVPDTMQSQLRLAGPLRFVANAFGPSLGLFELQGARITNDVQIGGLTLTRPAVIVRNRPSVLVGVPLMEQFQLTIDQKNRRLRIERPGTAAFEMPEQPWETASPGPTRQAAGAQPGDPPVGTWTTGFMMRGVPGGALTVFRVLPGSSAEKLGVQIGDELVELNGTAASAMTPAISARNRRLR